MIKLNIDKHIKEVKKNANGFSICKCLNFEGTEMVFYGLKNNHIYTNGYETIKELKNNHEELRKGATKQCK